MWFLRTPGVYRPQGDTRLLTELLQQAGLRSGSSVLDVGTGTGALAVAAVQAGAGKVTAIDISVRAVITARLNTLWCGHRVEVQRGDVKSDQGTRAFDVVVANPPYVPSPQQSVTGRGAARAWDAGHEGRAMLDHLCEMAPAWLKPGGTLLMVHSALAGTARTLHQLQASNMTAAIVARREQDFGPVLSRRAAMLEARGLIEPGQRTEELVVIRGDRPSEFS